MILPLFVGCAAVCVVCALLAVKWKKGRVPMAVLAVIALVPALGLGLIAVGAGGVLNYPGDPAAAVEGLVDCLGDIDYEAADEYVTESLGIDPEGVDGETVHLMDLMSMQWAVRCGEPVLEDFTAKLPVELTRLDREAWLTELAWEAETVLGETVESEPLEAVFNAAGDAYLDGVTEQAYQTAYGRMWGRGEEFLQTVSAELTLRWSPFGWKIVTDEALLSALELDAAALNETMAAAHKDIVEGLPLLHKTYQIPEDAVKAPKPQGVYGSTFDIAEVQAVIAQAERLLDGQELAWNPDLNFWPEEPIQYYYDETILALTWKEIINGNMVTFGEVKVAHGSQLRRALTGNRYGYGSDEYPTQMASNVNAVLAVNGDFYGFRDLGITVYQRQLYRHAPASVDTAYFTADGNMIFSKRGELTDRAAAEQFIADNDVLFAVAFGPIMVENGEPVHTAEYAIGEINDRYSRSAIAQKDELHYLVMTVNFEGPCQKTCTLEQAVQYISDKNVQMAYTLDGGQTASVVFNGEMVNRPDWGEERTMSDIIYFASAVPEAQ